MKSEGLHLSLESHNENEVQFQTSAAKSSTEAALFPGANHSFRSIKGCLQSRANSIPELKYMERREYASTAPLIVPFLCLMPCHSLMSPPETGHLKTAIVRASKNLIKICSVAPCSSEMAENSTKAV